MFDVQRRLNDLQDHVQLSSVHVGDIVMVYGEIMGHHSYLRGQVKCHLTCVKMLILVTSFRDCFYAPTLRVGGGGRHLDLQIRPCLSISLSILQKFFD